MSILNKRTRDALGAEYRYARRERHPDEAPARTMVPGKWDKSQPDLQWHVVRADPALSIKSRGV